MSRNIYQVGVAGSEGEFNTIQAAIDQAILDGHTDVDDPAVVEVLPGVYTEDFSLPLAITIRGFSQRTYIQETLEPVIIEGTVTVDLPLDGTINRTVAQMSGVQIRPASGPGIIFTGTDPSILNLDTVTVEALDDVAIRCENTGASSTVQTSQCVFRSLPGNTNPAVEVSAGLMIILSGFVERADPADVAIHVLGTGECPFVFGRMFGTFDIDGGNALLFNAFLQSAPGVAVADVAAGADFISTNSTWLEASGTLITGDGTAILGANTTFAPFVFDPALTVIPIGAALAASIAYDATPGDWVGSPPASQQEFNDRVASLLVALNAGPIP